MIKKILFHKKLSFVFISKKYISTFLIKMQCITKRYSHFINAKYIDKLIINDKVEYDYNYIAVYYVNCITNENYMDWISNQLNYIIHSIKNVYVIATVKDIDQEKKLREDIKNLFKNIIIECNYGINTYEYYGILKVWKLGQTFNRSDDILLYFHSKGITHHSDYSNNRNDAYNVILKNIDYISEIFDLFPSIDKVGYFSGGIGWIWYNFWYARGSYINQVEKPILTDRRHYYEDWLCRKLIDPLCNKQVDNIERPTAFYENTLLSCYSFYTDEVNFGNIGSYYDPNSNQMFVI